ncbi:MAG: 3'(2'),5'-bisphosphate nucleotidase CysQ [Magnetococcales bacterium]|nr:3'(2'),5'-bisphosphate nucleotidase CysQ [Magnetococcales bacterium]MBF0116567.1 3'(2'),5'-bisphosphate nucleotidase CysQ [Magnetococcales bacterium]
MSDLPSALAVMEAAARQAGTAIMAYFQPGSRVASHVRLQDKGRNNPVTKADMEANRLLHDTLLAAFPDHGWLSEESADSPDRLCCQRVWIVDPMDGTKEFVKGLPQFAISIALVDAGQPIAACIYNPATAELFTATCYGGAHLNGQRISTSSRQQLPGASCLASHSESQRGEWIPFNQDLMITQMGSIAYKLALVAAGRFDLSFTLTPKNEWDFCAGALLLQEAGGRISHKDGRAFCFNQHNPQVRSVLASNGHLHDLLLRYLESTPLSPDRQSVP